MPLPWLTEYAVSRWSIGLQNSNYTNINKNEICFIRRAHMDIYVIFLARTG